ncbi:MAG: HAMP domain-containing protein [Symploca sp. SIO2G7]|nr:HAMP domain-containing protein [Symploca sp. SIO2G7]
MRFFMTQSSSKNISQNVTNNHHLDDNKANLSNNNYVENEIDWNYEQSFFDTNALESESSTQPGLVPTQEVQSGISQGLSNLSIGRKTQLFPLLTLISLAGVVGFGSVALIGGLRSQLVDQIQSELAITELNYNIKIDQMGFGFRGQSDNTAIIDAAETHAEGELLTPKLQTQVKEILKNEIKNRNIEYATLVDRNLRIIINANADRSGQTFDPNNLVSQVFEEPQQIKSTEIVSWSELAKESPPLPEGFSGQDALIRYTVTPVNDPDTGEAIAALVSGDIVNGKLPIVKNTVDAFVSQGYSAVYLRQPTGEFALATSIDKTSSQEAKINIPLANTSLLAQAVEADGESVTGRLPIGNRTYTIAAKALSNSAGEPVAILAFGDPEVALGQIIRRSLLTQISLSVLLLVVVVSLALTLGKLIAEPLKQLQQITQEFSQGNYQLRAEIVTTDETGQLASTFNEMADNIEANVEEIRQKENLVRQKAEQEAASRQEAESLAEEQRQLQEEQRQLREGFQQRALELLMEVDPISRGDLTIRAKVTEDEIGTIADSYNATVGNLRKIVTQVQAAASQVAETTSSNEPVVQSLSQEALRQAEEVAVALEQAQEMAQAVQLVATNAQQAEAVVQQAAQTVEEGEDAMNRTVEGIMTIRETVAETAKKVKRLGESSQKISQVVNLISTFTEQTNLLALNASIEAAHAGEEGRGFAVVADEVRSLSRQSAEATAEIEKLVASIQTETNEVVAAMEAGTEQVVTGTKLVDETRQSLNKITAASAEINQLVEAIAKATTLQSTASEAVTKTMTDVATIASQTSTEANTVSSSFEQLRQVAQQLQAEVGQFKVS